MKNNKIRIGTVLILIVSFVLVQTCTAVNKPVLEKGDTGAAVSSLQRNLKTLGYLDHEPTGFFGDLTMKAVIRFQEEHGIYADGKVGGNTYDKISYFMCKPLLSKGNKNNEVKSLQSDLLKLGFMDQEPTGFFGSITENAVLGFQKKYLKYASGKADLLTYLKIDTLLSKLKNTRIIIDPGHGGIDAGTSKGSIVESQTNLDMSKLLNNYLTECGCNSSLTRSKDISLDSLSRGSGTRQLRDLSARVNIINTSKAAFFVSIHVNSAPDVPSNTGSIVYYDNKLPESKILAQNIQKALNSITINDFKRKSHDPQTGDYYILRNSNIPGVLVETAYITNSEERRLLATSEYKRKIVKAILSGIRETSLG